MADSRWYIEFSPAAEKEFTKLGFVEQKRVAKFIKEKILSADEPRIFGK
ncbi:MAG: hypothetical protein WCG05_04270 [Alphaproteobacteria bacterium]